MLIGVVGTVYSEMLVHNATQGEVAEGKLHGGVGLELHARVKAIEIHTSNFGTLGFVGRLLFHDAGKRIGFVGGKSGLLGLRRAFGRPKRIVLFLHAESRSWGVMSQ